ncbi:MAG TPA: DNA repair protein RadC [Chitinophagaceae bacterium]|nr:DNA repair protein RadC [Chitinophagaceae bacterium]
MQEHKYSIKQWAKDDRPREKLLAIGAENLSISELLAILIRNGSRQKTAVDLGKEVLKLGKDSLMELGKLSVKELMKIKGIGEAKAISIVAAMELGRRRESALPVNIPAIKSSEHTAQFIKARLTDLRHEVFGVLFLNRSNKVLHFEIVSEGGITGTVADPRIILKRALEEHAVGLIVCHNHPSGNLTPSQSDKDLTAKLKSAAALLDIKLLDHLIISEYGYFSFADEGIL